MNKTKTFILCGIVVVEFVIILALFFRPRYAGDFLIVKDEDVPFPNAYTFVSTKAKDTNGVIALDNQFGFSFILLKDNAGRFLTVGFDEDKIVSYVISDKKCNYRMETRRFPAGKFMTKKRNSI